MSDRFLNLSDAERREALGVAASNSGRPAHLLEQDVWVVWCLNALFSSPLGEHLVFKGGTSLSKAYGATHRQRCRRTTHLRRRVRTFFKVGPPYSFVKPPRELLIPSLINTCSASLRDSFSRARRFATFFRAVRSSKLTVKSSLSGLRSTEHIRSVWNCQTFKLSSDLPFRRLGPRYRRPFTCSLAPTRFGDDACAAATIELANRSPRMVTPHPRLQIDVTEQLQAQHLC
ncbi:hypothetical protein ABIA45_007224 [Bradyrhizobium sp. USDA 336]|uniref:Nucleotidyl transferase AbiEii toxin, Type IV TA system n=1 Tax=Bradyrhizobium yuanmingense TaxID=108015 RepID=A0ABV4GQA0_9BRAD